MSKIFKLAASIFLVVALCFSFTLENSVSAASKDSKPKQDAKAMRLFRQSLLNTVGDTNQIFRQFFIFMVPDFQGELTFNGKVDGHTLAIAGELGFWMTGNDGKTTDFETPFYITQSGKDMVFYYKTDNQWTKYSAPSVAANLMDVITSPTKEEIEKEVSMVKSVDILQDNDSRSILLVRLDGAKLAEELKASANENPADKGTAEEVAMQNKIFSYLDTGLRNADLWYTWKIDKKNNRTGAITFDLSPIIHETALAVLDDPDNKDLPDPIKEILETFAYYSELKAYTSFLGSEAEASLAVPQEVIDTAVPSKDLVNEQKINENTSASVEVTENK